MNNTTTNNLPLVSVDVITYNSADTIIEALNSVAAQTYPKIELIVSDDCSKDNTIALVQNWIEAHKKRFVRTQIVTADKNTGVTGNYSRAAEACQGEWIKDLDGDDILLPNCIELYIDYVTKNPDTIYLFGKVEVLGENELKVRNFEDTIFDYTFFDLSAEEQYKWLITRSFQPIASVTSFYHRQKTEEAGIIYDTRIPMLEDWPRWIQLVKAGIKLHFVNSIIARYRVSGSVSICSGTMYSESFRRSLALMYVYYQYEPSKSFLGRRKAWARYVGAQKIISNRITWKVLYEIIQILLLPKKLIKKLKI